MKVRKGLSGGQYKPLNEQDIKKIHETSMKVFSEIGVQVNFDEARGLFGDAGAEVELFYAKDLKVRSCACNDMYCWYKKPGECCFQDDMDNLYPKLRKADILVLATPVYIPLPGEFQNVINRLCPLIQPAFGIIDGRTRAKFREDVNISKLLLVSTGGWWEKENFDTLVRIIKELAELVSVEFGGAILRPHAYSMKKECVITEAGDCVLSAVRSAGYELVVDGDISLETLELISQPLISESVLRRRYNQLL